MAPPIQFNTHSGSHYTPTSDALDRHEFGIAKTRKTTSTGGGRAWSEDEVSNNVRKGNSTWLEERGHVESEEDGRLAVLEKILIK